MARKRRSRGRSHPPAYLSGVPISVVLPVRRKAYEKLAAANFVLDARGASRPTTRHKARIHARRPAPVYRRVRVRVVVDPVPSDARVVRTRRRGKTLVTVAGIRAGSRSGDDRRSYDGKRRTGRRDYSVVAVPRTDAFGMLADARTPRQLMGAMAVQAGLERKWTR